MLTLTFTQTDIDELNDLCFYRSSQKICNTASEIDSAKQSCIV